MQKLRTMIHMDAGKEQCIVAYGTSLTEGGVWLDELRSFAGTVSRTCNRN